MVAQTKKQQRILSQAHKVKSSVIPMPSPPTGDGSHAVFPDMSSPRVVWVGRIAHAKRLEMLLDMAELAPDITFEVAGMPDPAGPYAEALVNRGNSLANVRMLGRVERHKVPELYTSAVCLCCTSIHEGFPNTFLEAWSQGVPVVSTFDPDGLIADRGLGAVSDSAEGLLDEIRKLMASREAWCAASKRGYEYYVANHLPANVVPKFEILFQQLAAHVSS